ncbi:MAG: hypothetical protein J5894_01475 [Clostridia bacterium]|nr:hypothetical protein [Clostridia bacterium]
MTKEIDFKRIFQKLLKYWWIVAIVTIVCGVGAFLFTHFFIAPVYQTSAQYEATNFALNSEGEVAGTTTSSYVQVKEALVKDYIKRVNNNDELISMVLEQVNSYYDEKTETYPYADVTAGTIKSVVTASPEGDSSMFTIKVNSTDPQFAEVVITAYDDNIITFMEKKEQRRNVIDRNNISNEAKKVSPNKLSNTMLGAIAGFAVVVIIIAVTVILDNMIRTEEDLKQKFSLPVLGVIPKWENSGKERE